MKYLRVVIPIFALMTLVSQSAMDLFSILVCGGVGLIWFRSRPTGRFQSDFFRLSAVQIALFAWFTAVVLSFILSPYGATEAGSRLVGFKWVFIMYCTAWGIGQTDISSRLIRPASILLAACSAYAIFVYFLARDPINPSYDLAPWTGGHRTGGFLSNAMTFAHVYGVYFCLFVGVTLHALSSRTKDLYWLFFALVVTGIALVLSFTRGVWLAVFFSTLFMGFVYRPKVGLVLASCGAAVFAILVFVFPAMRERVSQFSLTGDERSWIWAAHWKIFTDHPWTGVGYTQNALIVPEYYLQTGAPSGTIVSHAHNQYLQWLAGTGVVGLLAYLSFIVILLRLNWRSYFSIPEGDGLFKGLALGCLGAQICFLIGGLTEANFEHSKMKYVMLIIWALVIYLARRYGVETKYDMESKRNTL